mmetsp:Transcript_6444/g.26142  ORF Transcript_6444/g.26142 Transcript_6444/m.26142 type:complete len:84 (+) Transcript_6444:1408-1659(+)
MTRCRCVRRCTRRGRRHGGDPDDRWSQCQKKKLKALMFGSRNCVERAGWSGGVVFAADAACAISAARLRADESSCRTPLLASK